MMKSFEQVISAAKNSSEKPRIIAACPYDQETIDALNMAFQDDLCRIIVVGEKDKMQGLILDKNKDGHKIEIIEVSGETFALEEAYKNLLMGYAHIFMKGLVQTKEFMKVLLSDKNFITSDLLTHISIFYVPHLDKLLFVTDPSIVIEPTVEQKIVVIRNAVELAVCLGIENPKVAVVSSTEQINTKIKSSYDAEKLTRLFEQEKKFSGHVYGPLALDNAVSMEAAEIKKIDHVVAGNADILVMPDLDAGNILAKGLTYLGNLESAGVVVGARSPIVLTSRSANAKERYNSISVTCIAAAKCVESKI